MTTVGLPCGAVPRSSLGVLWARAAKRAGRGEFGMPFLPPLRSCGQSRTSVPRIARFHTPSGNLLHARGELCDAPKEGESAPSAPP